MGWADGHKEIKRLGREFVSNVLHDDYLVKSDGKCGIPKHKGNAWKELHPYYQKGAWADEMLAYPPFDQSFSGRMDAEDSYPDRRGRRWVLPLCYIPERAIENKNTYLLVIPKQIETTDEKVIIHPAGVLSFRYLPCFVKGVAGNSLSGYYNTTEENFTVIKDGGIFGGKVHPLVRLPTDENPVTGVLTDGEYKITCHGRGLVRTSGVGVRPIARQSGFMGLRRQYIYANLPPDTPLGVAYAENLSSDAIMAGPAFPPSNLREIATTRLAEDLQRALDLAGAEPTPVRS
jgi:hypothetical protein